MRIGNMISDKSEGITEIKWTVSGKIASIDWNGTKNLAFLYDASGQRVMKQLVNGATTTTTWYIRDASGNVMSTYSENAGALQLDETYIYGSSRIGSYNANLVLGQSTGGNDPIQMVEYFRGEIVYELSNHLGNVLAVITDRKIGSKLSGPGNWEHFEVDYKSFSDYYPYGMLMDGRSYTSGNYRFGFNGMEKNTEINSNGSNLDFGARIYDGRIGRWMSVDPLQLMYVALSPYNFVANCPIIFIDPDGRKIKFAEGTSRADKKLFRKSVRASNAFKSQVKKLKKSDVLYVVNFTNSNLLGGSINLDLANSKIEPEKSELRINVNIGGVDKATKLNALGNEISGANQFEDGKTGFGVLKNDKTKAIVTGYDALDEEENIRDQVNLVDNYNKKYKSKLDLTGRAAMYKKFLMDPKNIEMIKYIKEKEQTETVTPERIQIYKAATLKTVLQDYTFDNPPNTPANSPNSRESEMTSNIISRMKVEKKNKTIVK